MDDPDLAWLRRVAEGDEGALERLYARHSTALLRYAQRLLGDREAAEEALQDTFVALWQGAGSFEGRSAVRTWLFGICRRQALTRAGRRREESLPVDYAEAFPDGAARPDDVVLARADADAVGAALARLPAAQREVIHLAFAAELPHAAIAQLLSIPVGTVKSRLFQARAALARALPGATAVERSRR
ncbi:RNA polymerase sigma factor [Dactylosporangium matsuzakiense]|uniref:RNA polymerase sigma factor n=1 Tax=Dactylosporangium matsuzakiense TaxID=53360 RepID=A0A9W6NSG5_9ACTN|nr:sigma-70 family RNA polymerase sigma factor [Dactylosporangium matsuzakiense]UWZ48423.1 sigma-70 family RNA polymerase sigma factor [Dactylosporangium matsuzakiense]GLL07107.1 RNA polymerase sigma factor [Dactylosporangium matsuzakiense]